MTMRIALLAALAASLPVRAAEDLKETKMVYDVTEGDGQKLLGRIETIDETREDIAKAGGRPVIVLSFRGPATKLVQTDMAKVKPEDRAWAAKIQARLEAMSKSPSVALEQCAVAIRHQSTSRDKVLPVIKVVENSFITIAAYQAQGYAYIVP